MHRSHRSVGENRKPQQAPRSPEKTSQTRSVHPLHWFISWIVLLGIIGLVLMMFSTSKVPSSVERNHFTRPNLRLQHLFQKTPSFILKHKVVSDYGTAMREYLERIKVQDPEAVVFLYLTCSIDKHKGDKWSEECEQASTIFTRAIEAFKSEFQGQKALEYHVHVLELQLDARTWIEHPHVIQQTLELDFMDLPSLMEITGRDKIQRFVGPKLMQTPGILEFVLRRPLRPLAKVHLINSIEELKDSLASLASESRVFLYFTVASPFNRDGQIPLEYTLNRTSTDPLLLIHVAESLKEWKTQENPFKHEKRYDLSYLPRLYRLEQSSSALDGYKYEVDDLTQLHRWFVSSSRNKKAENRIISVSGYEEAFDEYEKLSKEVPIFLFFTCSAGNGHNRRWADLCTEVVDVVYKQLKATTVPVQVVEVLINQTEWDDPELAWKKDFELKLKRLPSFSLWQGLRQSDDYLSTTFVKEEGMVKYVMERKPIISGHERIRTIDTMQAFNRIVLDFPATYPLFVLFISAKLQPSNRPWCGYCRVADIPTEYTFYTRAPLNARFIRIEVAKTYGEWKSMDNPFKSDPRWSFRGVPRLAAIQKSTSGDISLDIFPGQLSNQTDVGQWFAGYGNNEGLLEKAFR